MEISKNTLVKHKRLNSLGIGIVNRSLKNKVEVRFGQKEIGKFSHDEIAPVDTTGVKTVPRAFFESGGVKDDFLIFGNLLQHFMGIGGWIFIRVATEDDLKRFKVII